MKKTWKKTLAAIVMVLALGILAGCSAKQEEGIALAETGTLILKVNPEIKIGYDEAGKVVSLIGTNAEGKKIVENYKDYIGKECRVVVSDLVEDIRDAGYFVEEVEGEGRKITIEIEKGSVLPAETFLTDIAADVQDYITKMEMSSPIVVGGTDYDVKIYEAPEALTNYDATDYGPLPQAPATPAPETSVPTTPLIPAKPVYDATDYDGEYTDYRDPNTDYDHVYTDYDDPNTNYATNYDATDYDDPNTDYHAPKPAPKQDPAPAPKPNTDYDDPMTDYDNPNTNYDDPNTDYDDPATNYGRSDYGRSDYDD